MATDDVRKSPARCWVRVVGLRAFRKGHPFHLINYSLPMQSSFLRVVTVDNVFFGANTPTRNFFNNETFSRKNL